MSRRCQFCGRAYHGECYHGMTAAEWKEYRREPVADAPERTPRIHIVFDGPPGPEAGRFVEVENDHGESIRRGHWEDHGDYWHLCFPDHAALGRERDLAREHASEVNKLLGARVQEVEHLRTALSSIAAMDYRGPEPHAARMALRALTKPEGE